MLKFIPFSRISNYHINKSVEKFYINILLPHKFNWKWSWNSKDNSGPNSQIPTMEYKKNMLYFHKYIFLSRYMIWKCNAFFSIMDKTKIRSIYSDKLHYENMYLNKCIYVTSQHKKYLWRSTIHIMFHILLELLDGFYSNFIDGYMDRLCNTTIIEYLSLRLMSFIVVLK